MAEALAEDSSDCKRLSGRISDNARTLRYGHPSSEGTDR